MSLRPLGRLSSCRCCRAAVAAAAFCAAASAQILENHSGSLTTYLAGKSGVQDAKARPEQRATNLDGSLRRGSTFGISIAGNPFENAWHGETEIDGIRLDTGTWSPTDVDLHFPAQVPWVIGRSFNARQTHSGAQFDSSGPQGVNWFQTSMPELVVYEDNGNHANDVIYVLLGADRFLEYGRVDSTSAEYKGKNGAAGRIVFTAGSPDTYKLLDQSGTDIYFFGFDTASHVADGQLWRIVAPDSAVAFVGDASDAATAVTNGYDNGRVKYAFDSTNRRFTYAHNSDTPPHISQVKAETKSGGTWFGTPTGVIEVGRVDYTYYGNESFGDAGDLKAVTVTLPRPEANEVRVTYYRYWEGTFNSTSNPGHPHAIKLVLDAEGTRRMDWGKGRAFDADYLTEPTADLRPFAAAYLEYDSNHKVNFGWFNGQCGCGNAGSGAFTLRYETNASYSNDAGYDPEWARRTVVGRPDGSFLTQYFDEVGQALHRVVTDVDPASTDPYPLVWVDHVVRDAAGCVTEVASPANVTGYTHGTSSATLTRDATAGLIRLFERTSSGTLSGFVSAEQFKFGTDTSESTPPNPSFYDRALTYSTPTEEITPSGGTVARPLISADKHYVNASTSQVSADERFDSVTWTVSPDTIAVTERSVTRQTVATNENGSGAAGDSVSKVHFTLGGLPDYERDADSRITYRTYSDGLLTTVTQDADTSSLSEPSGFEQSGSPLDISTSYTYDDQGRVVTTTLPSGRVTATYYTVLGDRRLVRLDFPRYQSGDQKVFGPVRYSVTNLAGRTEVDGVIALSGSVDADFAAFIDESDADARTAVDVGTLAQLRTWIMDDAGRQVSAERAYFAIPSSLPGTDGTHFDATLFGYDDLGRRWRVKEPHGTITRTVFDARGLAVARYVGTNDSTFDDGEAGTDNMVKVEESVYDGGADGGNGFLTQRTLFVEGSATGQRVTTFANDGRGRAIAVVNPTAPHSVSAFDNLGRVTATAQYSSSSGLSASSAPTTTTNRLALSETLYDERGQVWKSVRHEIDPSDGGSDDSLESQSWFDLDGRLAKRDGEQLEKFKYDRLGRQTHRYVLASVDSAEDAWDEARTVADDFVLEEHQSAFDVDGAVLLEVAISRVYAARGASAPTGAIDGNADGDPLLLTAGDIATMTIGGQTKGIGRVQITARWYDDLDRLADVVLYGTNDETGNVATFDRDGLGVPSRSATALRTSYEYNTDGTLKQVTDPKGLITRYEYDSLGRRTKVIANYVDGTPGGGTYADEDQTVAYAFTDGLQVSITADLPAGQTDQVTTYFHGTKVGTPSASKIATGDLVRAVVYPDSTNTGDDVTDFEQSGGQEDVVTFCYNAQGQEVLKKDQAGNVIETSYDGSGRPLARVATAIATSPDVFDDAVQRIDTAFDGLGRVSTVTQYSEDDLESQTCEVVDQVKYLYDGWGNLTNFQQDVDSAVGGSGYWEVAYAHEKKAGLGRNTLRRTQIELPGGTFVYNYRSGTGIFDDDASRVTQIQDDAETALVTYDYNGVGQLMQTQLEEVAAFSKLFTASGVSFSGLDRFDRIKVSKWTKDLSTNRDFYKVTWAYDENSNVLSADDAVHTGHDVAYTNDGLNRLIEAKEGTWNGSAITNPIRDQAWTLTQTGNWSRDRVRLNLDVDSDYNDTGEVDDTRAHNAVNELQTRDTDTDSSVDFTLSYDAVGNMRSDGESYRFVYDVFGRLVLVTDLDTDTVEELRYNGLGYLIGQRADWDGNGLSGGDPWFYGVYDERWRRVADARAGYGAPKASYLHHCAGASGYGGSSYIDAVVLRDRDIDDGWTAVPDGTLEERVYLCQDPRHADVVAIVRGNGTVAEWVTYSPYGVPFAIPPGDLGGNGDNADDESALAALMGSSGYSPIADIDFDGALTDEDAAAIEANPQVLGRGVLSASGVGNRKGYAGYDVDSAATSFPMVRQRTLSPSVGRWLTRDPLGYIDGVHIYQYARNAPVSMQDPTGLKVTPSDKIKPYHDALMECCPKYREMIGTAPGPNGTPPGSGLAGDTSEHKFYFTPTDGTGLPSRTPDTGWTSIGTAWVDPKDPKKGTAPTGDTECRVNENSREDCKKTILAHEAYHATVWASVKGKAMTPDERRKLDSKSEAEADKVQCECNKACNLDCPPKSGCPDAK